MSSPKSIGPIRKAWYNWKALRLPWRKRFLVGLDLNGNTFWEFRDVRGAEAAPGTPQRWRRIVQYPRSTHYADVKVSPQWHSWLRHTRADPPSLDEQARDLARQAQMRRLAAEADARWAAKPGVMDAPAAAGLQQIQQQQESGAGEGPEGGEGQRTTAAAPMGDGTRPQAGDDGTAGKRGPETPDPWKTASKGGPSEEWQPQSWTPTAKR
ncbi:uncharacterized protein E0L32_009018 [Thyridium curvatum]|uniref:Uncharacterized protein n=1 Tax=Thyridium curvatum TaxID=1093900 RepID=A0A507AQX2_9PEZI|nr:uncharacterized protein E0L32_009018 [Thyridium curvatum]TPX09827.1 hypothetical protein E0L32_009018 [Thyridium curvatum]